MENQVQKKPKLSNYEIVATLIERELTNLSLINCRRLEENGKWEYQFQHLSNSRMENLIAGADFQSDGPWHNLVIFDKSSGLQESDIQTYDIFIQSGTFTSLVHEILLHHDVRIAKKYFETNTYSTTLKLGIRVRPFPSSTSSSKQDTVYQRNKVFIKFRESLQHLVTVIRREGLEKVMIDKMISSNGAQNSSSEPSSSSAKVANEPVSSRSGSQREQVSNEILYELVLSLSQKINQLENEIISLHRLISTIQSKSST